MIPLSSSLTTVSRQQYLQIVQCGLDAQEISFSREAISHWLTAFPGDLQAGLLNSKTLILEGKPARAIPILSNLCDLIPEFLQAHETLSSCLL